MKARTTYVIGGGLAGLTAAAALATAGEAVTVVEAASTLGGRARSRRRDGFALNLGPHAVFKGGPGYAVLRRLGVSLPGGSPRMRRYGVLTDEGLGSFTRFAARLGHPVRATRAITGAGHRGSPELAGTSVNAWLDATLEAGPGRQLAEALLRTANYAADFDLLDAGAATRQLRNAMRGVHYVDGGWQTIVDDLAGIVVANGGRIWFGVPVRSIHHDGTATRGLTLDDGTELDADRVIVAVSDARRAAALLDGPPLVDLEVAAGTLVPIRMAHLDVAVRPLPQRHRLTVLGIDRRVFVSTPSDVAAVAPDDGAVVSVGRYLAPDEEGVDHRAELEAALEAVQPGWTDHAVDVRYVPRSMVAGDHPRVATRGTIGRPTVGIAGVTGLAVAGDWIGPHGTLADASLRSGWDAAASVSGRAPATPESLAA